MQDLSRAIFLVEHEGELAVATGGRATLGDSGSGSGSTANECDGIPIIAMAPALHPAQLGDATFCDDHRIRLPYMTGAMANGIASAEIVEAMARAGMLGSFGAAGLTVDQVAAAIDRITANVGDRAYCVNLIHSPNEPAVEAGVVELYLQQGVRLVEASAYLDLTLPVVRYRVSGLHRDASGGVVAPNRIIAKASRIEVATKWFSPPPARLVNELVAAGQITADEAELSQHIPMAQDLTAEADSGGHTDNRPAITMIPTFLALRDRLAAEYGYAADMPLRVGAAGGIATPASAAAAFAMGAAYIVTGSVNQACVEAGSCEAVRAMLAATEQADVTMAPAADMFEMGVKLQVLKRGTMFAMRAAKLYEIYRTCDSIEAIPAADRASIEKTLFRASLDDIWQQTRDFFMQRDPEQVARAERDGKHKMALVFRWYLGLSSRWANAGEPSRKMDYQVWCGPAMGAFNEWARGTYLEQPEQRRVADIARQLLHGAAVVTRLNHLRSQGVTLPATVAAVRPVDPATLEAVLS